MADLNRYRVWCITENAYQYIWDVIPPTACIHDPGHVLDPNSITIVDTRPDNIVTPALFVAPTHKFEGRSVMAVVLAGTTQDIDFKISGTGYALSGADWVAYAAAIGDWIRFAIVDVDNILGYGPELELQRWIDSWYVFPDHVNHSVTPEGGAIMAGLYMRGTYHSVGQQDVSVLINYWLHRDLAASDESESS